MLDSDDELVNDLGLNQRQEQRLRRQLLLWRVRLEADYCLEDLDSYLDNELEMEQELLDEQDDDDDDEEESDGEGYITDDEVEDEEPANFDIAAWLFHIQI